MRIFWIAAVIAGSLIPFGASAAEEDFLKSIEGN